MASIVIPAHEEERVLGETLERVLAGLDPSVEVIVVCNGCRDRTSEVARLFVPRVVVLELDIASKTAALNAGDAAARTFPRIYLDADVPIEGSHLMRIIGALQQPGALAAEPRARFDLSGASALVRSYYAVWRGLHGGRPGDVGCGLYALSEEGRARFREFPPVIADDGFARAHFAPGEIRLVEEAYSVVRAPRSLAALVRVKTRSKLGTFELARRYPELWSRKSALTRSLGSKARALPPRLWPLLPVYAAIQFWVNVRARRTARDLAGYRWERDR